MGEDFLPCSQDTSACATVPLLGSGCGCNGESIVASVSVHTCSCVNICPVFIFFPYTLWDYVFA